MLDVYRAQSGQMELFYGPVSLAAIGQEVASGMQGAAAEHELRLEVELPATPLLAADGDKLLRVLLNLVSNAIKFTRRGAVAVTAAVDGEAHIIVRDTGVGIPADQLDKIFDRFFQGGGQGGRRGTGLGLTFCREVVRAHGGRIWAVSDVGRGTAIYFTLPIARPL